MGHIDHVRLSVYMDPSKKVYLYKVFHKYQNAVQTRENTKIRMDDFLTAACQALERDIEPHPRVI